MKIIENPVVEEWGYVHPEYFDFGDRDWVTKTEWQAWLDSMNIEESVYTLEDEDSEFSQIYFEGQNTDLSEWDLPVPEGEGWFLGAVFDTENGPYCIWLRNK